MKDFYIIIGYNQIDKEDYVYDRLGIFLSLEDANKAVEETLVGKKDYKYFVIYKYPFNSLDIDINTVYKNRIIIKNEIINIKPECVYLIEGLDCWGSESIILGCFSSLIEAKRIVDEEILTNYKDPFNDSGFKYIYIFEFPLGMTNIDQEKLYDEAISFYTIGRCWR